MPQPGPQLVPGTLDLIVLQPLRCEPTTADELTLRVHAVTWKRCSSALAAILRSA